MILIKNTKVVDGTGGPAQQADVLISGDTISAIGNFPNKKTETVIDGLGMYVTPGFIDMHTHADHTLDLFTNPRQDHYRAQGITTIIGGNDGASLAPLLYGSLESIRKWTNINAINVNWHSVHEFYTTLNKRDPGVTFMTLVGYSTIRRDIARRAGADLADKEMAVILKTIEQALHEGALGVSINLGSAHGKGVAYEELKAVAEAVARAHGVCALRLRKNTGHSVEAAHEALSIYKSTGVTMIIHCEQNLGIAYEIIKNAGDNLYIEMALDEIVPTPIYELLPPWAHTGTLDTMYELVCNPAHRKEFLKQLPQIRGNYSILHAPREHRILAHKTLKEFSENRDLSVKEGLLELMRVTRMRAVLGIPKPLIPLEDEYVNDDRTLITGSLPALFKTADRCRWPVEKTVAKITGIPATIFNIKNRGFIQENYYADLVVMNNRYEIAHVLKNGAL